MRNQALEDARRELRILIEDFKDRASTDRDERKMFLLDWVSPTIEAFIGPLRGMEIITPLSDLLRELQALDAAGWAGMSDARFDELWDRTLRVLGDFVEQKSEPERGSRRSFWKRPR